MLLKKKKKSGCEYYCGAVPFDQAAELLYLFFSFYLPELYPESVIEKVHDASDLCELDDSAEVPCSSDCLLCSFSCSEENK